MQSAFNRADKNKQASKMVLKWGGDWKTPKYGAFWTVKYQGHKGKYNTE